MARVSGFLFVAPVRASVFDYVGHRLEHYPKLPHLFVPLLAWRAKPASLGLHAMMRVFVLALVVFSLSVVSLPMLGHTSWHA